MRISDATICTLATLGVLNFTYPAIASASSQVQSTGVKYYQDYQTVVVPTTEANNSNQPGRVTSTPIQSAPVNDLVVSATDVQIVGADAELQQLIRNVIKTRVGGETSESQLQQDVTAILNTGLFKTATVNSRSTSAGLNVVYQVQPVVVRSLQVNNAKVLPLNVAQQRFQSQFGKTISPTALSQSVQQINQWYAQNGYTLARVLAIKPSPEGALTLEVAEGVVNNVKFQFVDAEGNAIDAQGKPIKGRTRQEFLRRELKIKPNQVFREDFAQQDLQQLYKLGLFEDVKVSLAGDAQNVDVIYNLTELPARGVNVGGGYNDESGIYGLVSYKDFNFGGINDSVGLDVQASRRDLQFDANYINAYRPTEPDRFGYQINAFRRRGISPTFEGDINLANGDRAREGEFGGSITLQRPIEDWQASMGLNYKRTSIRDRSGKVSRFDELGNPLSFSGTGIDDLTTISFNATKDQRDNAFNPTTGSVLSLSTEQSIPIGSGNIAMNRLQANYSQYIPVQVLNTKDPEVLAFNVQGGTVIGDLPPYEAFNIGGLNSVRGYGTGEVASGRSYVLASAEYRFPVFKAVGGVLFADFASDLGSQTTVLGEPGIVRDKPGTGFGYGAGVRLNSPIGLIRADFGFNNEGESRLQFGIGQRF